MHYTVHVISIGHFVVQQSYINVTTLKGICTVVITMMRYYVYIYVCVYRYLMMLYIYLVFKLSAKPCA